VAKRLFVFLLLGFVLLVIGCWWVTSRAAPDPAESYTTVPVEYGRAADIVSATGPVTPRDIYTVGTELSGKVIEVRADFNQEVEEGELLARIDDQPLRERLKMAELSVQEARAGVEQAQAARDAASTAVQREQERSPEVRRQIDIDVAQHQLKTAEAAIALQQVKVQEAEEAKRHAEDDLRRAEIRAPVLAPSAPASASAPPDRSGIGAVTPNGTPPPRKRTFTVLDRAVSVNQMVAPPASGRLFTLAGGLEQMQVELQVSEGDVAKIARGQTADVMGPGSDPGPAFAGRVEDVRLTPISEHGAVFYKAVIAVQNERDPATHDWRLRPGMTANVDVLLRVHDSVWKVPAAALSFQFDPVLQSEAAKAKLARWQAMKDHDQWRPVWTPGAGPDRRPWPILVRIGGRDARGETGVQTAEFSEVLEWDPEMQPPDPKDEGTYPQVIIAAPQPKRSFFTMPKVKL
jgi:HlyD family secretion protein